MKITFLGQSGFSVDTGSYVLLFDYCPRRKKTETDALLPGIFQNRTPLVFVSHAHGDHFTEDIYDLPTARYLIGSGVPARRNAIPVEGGRTYDFDGFQLKTFVSTDEGVAFLLHIDGFSIFHAGDLNWWHWAEESEAWNRSMKAAFLTQARLLAEEPIDLAFLPTDPRLGDAWLWGFDALMQPGNIRFAVPMHFWNVPSVPQRVLSAEKDAPYDKHIVPLCAIGDSVTLEKERFL